MTSIDNNTSRCEVCENTVAAGKTIWAKGSDGCHHDICFPCARMLNVDACPVCNHFRPGWLFGPEDDQCLLCQGEHVCLKSFAKLLLQYNRITGASPNNDLFLAQFAVYDHGYVFWDEDNEAYDYDQITILLRDVAQCILSHQPMKITYKEYHHGQNHL